MVPLDALHSVKNKKYVLINLRSNKKLRALIMEYDQHFNMFLSDVTEYTQTRVKILERKIEKMFLRGDNVIAVVF